MKSVKTEIELGGRTLTLEGGRLAPQATASVLATYGETVVLATITAADSKEDKGYFPLSVEYQERLYAGGRIKGSRWVKREGRPSDDEILTARLIDRSIRPLFPNSYKKEVQVIITVLSVDLENDPRIVAGSAVAGALAISGIPNAGPVAIVNIGTDDKDEFIVNPLVSQEESSKLEIFVSSTAEAIVMIEAGANELPEEKILAAIELGQKEGKALIKGIADFAKKAGVKTEELEETELDKALVKKVEKLVAKKLPGVVQSLAKVESGRSTEFSDLVAEVEEALDEDEKALASEILEKLKKGYIRAMIHSGKRLDGRALNEIRELSSEVGVLPRTHGSGIFQRGATQVLTIATIGAPSLGQLIETAEGEEEKRYIHHYSMPPYSVGEVGRVGSPGRREIGHGALAERALMPVIPSESEFPYAIRLVSEVLSSNGSTSMASTCGSTLSLMDAGVPIKAPVGGIAMGLVIDGDKVAVLTDIAGIEDFNGDMDFKVAGTKEGVTALQLDVKTLALTSKILKDALTQAKKARLEVLDSMLKTIDKPRSEVSKHAPKIKSIKIPVDKIGELIGPGGKTIKGIIAKTGAQVDVDDDGVVNISGISEEGVAVALATVENMVKEVEKGEIYEGTVKRMENYGIFVEILPGKDGMVHISDMSEGFVKSPEELVKMGDKISVRVKEVDHLGRINLSMILDPSKDKTPEKKEGERRSFDSGRGRGGFRGRDQDRDRDRGRENSKSSGGPHFPTSRLVADKKPY